MSDLSINGNKFNIEPKTSLGFKDDLKVEKVRTPGEVKLDWNDDIVVKDNKGKFTAISADELEIKNGKVPVGMPKVGDTIKLFDSAGNVQVEGEVVSVDDENDNETTTKKVSENLSFDAGVKTEFLDALKTKYPSISIEGFSFGKVDTHKEKSFDVAIKAGGAGGSAVVSGAYTFISFDDDLMETLYPFGNKILNEPHSITPVASMQAVVNVGPDELSAGYKTNLGVEVNRPFKNDFSFSFATMLNMGVQNQGKFFIEPGVGLDARYELDKKTTLSVMPFYSARVAFGDEGKEKSKGAGVQVGANFKF